MTLKNARKLGKLAKFFWVVLVPRQILGKMTKKRLSEIQKFSEENVEISRFSVSGAHAHWVGSTDTPSHATKKLKMR